MPGASAEKLKFLVRSTLMDASTVTDVVGGRIYGAHLQDPDARTSVYPLVVLDFRAGLASTSTYQQVTMDLWAYSRDSSGEALRLYDLCQAALQQQLLRRDGVPVAGYAMELNRPAEGWNEKVRAYYAQGEYTLRAVRRD
jgi:hypothetical protein